MNWLNTDKALKNKFNKDISRDDGIKNILNEENLNNHNISHFRVKEKLSLDVTVLAQE